MLSIRSASELGPRAFSQNYLLKIPCYGTGEMAPWLECLLDLTEDPAPMIAALNTTLLRV